MIAPSCACCSRTPGSPIPAWPRRSACRNRPACDASGRWRSRDSIQGYTALIDQQKAGYPVNVFVSITLDRQSQSGLEAFENAVRKIPEVMECYLMTGEHDYLLRLVVADLADFERIHNQHLTRLPSVASVQSSFAMRTVTRSATLPGALSVTGLPPRRPILPRRPG